MGGLGLVADGGIVENDRTHPWMIGREGDEQPAAHAMPDGRGPCRVRIHPLDEVLPGLTHLAEELAVGVLRL